MNLGLGVLVFSMGFAAGALLVLAGLLIARVRRESLRNGDRFLARLGAVGAQRFLEVVQD